VTETERQLLLVALCAMKRMRNAIDEIGGVEAVIHALRLANGRTEIALARLRIEAGLLELKGTPSAYLGSFLAMTQTEDDTY
jgi:hypothetical protein